MDIKFEELLKLKPQYVVPVLLTTSALLFISEDSLKVVGLNSLPRDYKLWIGLAFLLSAALLASHFLFWAWSSAKEKNSKAKELKARIAKLTNLTPAEKGILECFIDGNTKTIQLSPSGQAGAMEIEGLIFKSTNIGSAYSWAYTIQPWLWQHLKLHPELLEGAIVESESSFF